MTLAERKEELIKNINEGQGQIQQITSTVLKLIGALEEIERQLEEDKAITPETVK